MEKVYYKATDKDMKCRGVQFELGVWSKAIEGDLKLCENGYHFCVNPSGVWAYYSDEGTRVFKCIVEDAILSNQPGADGKSICRRIKLIEEVFFDGNYNTGDRNTGNWNTGNRNTGHWNTGNRNTGNCNTGNWNTGYSNTGYWNHCNYSSGNFCMQDAPLYSFDKIVKDMTRDEYNNLDVVRDYIEVLRANEVLKDYSKFLGIPNSTKSKLKELHIKFINSRKDV